MDAGDTVEVRRLQIARTARLRQSTFGKDIDGVRVCSFTSHRGHILVKIGVVNISIRSFNAFLVGQAELKGTGNAGDAIEVRLLLAADTILLSIFRQLTSLFQNIDEVAD